MFFTLVLIDFSRCSSCPSCICGWWPLWWPLWRERCQCFALNFCKPGALSRLRLRSERRCHAGVGGGHCLGAIRSQRGRVCVCVCACVCVSPPAFKENDHFVVIHYSILTPTISLYRLAGGSDPFSRHCPTKTLLIGCDIQRGRSLSVPVPIFTLPVATFTSCNPNLLVQG